MSLAFLAVDPALRPAATEPVEGNGWRLVDRSHLAKLEVQGAPAAVDRARGEVVLRTSPDRALIVGERPLDDPAGVWLADLTAGYAAFQLTGPRARTVLERLTALDVRPGRLPAGEFRAGVVARVPALLARTGDDVYLVLVGTPVADDVWWEVSERA